MKFFNYSLLFALLFTQEIALNAKELNPKEAAQQSIQENLTMPQPDADGRVRTLNKMGAMYSVPSTVLAPFIEISQKPGAKVLDIGATYGLTCQEALQAGCEDYTAIDLDERHLKILAKNSADIDPAYLNHLKLVSGSFPAEINLPTNHYDAVLMARVLQFMTPHEITESLTKAYDSLKPGASIYAVLLTPYVKGYASFIPEFQKRLDAGIEFPGFVENKLDYTDKTVPPQTRHSEPTGHICFFDTKTAQKVFEKAGFIVEKSEYSPLAYKSDSWKLDGREYVILIAKKP